jgi:hypothetical protein
MIMADELKPDETELPNLDPNAQPLPDDELPDLDPNAQPLPDDDTLGYAGGPPDDSDDLLAAFRRATVEHLGPDEPTNEPLMDDADYDGADYVAAVRGWWAIRDALAELVGAVVRAQRQHGDTCGWPWQYDNLVITRCVAHAAIKASLDGELPDGVPSRPTTIARLERLQAALTSAKALAGTLNGNEPTSSAENLQAQSMQSLVESVAVDRVLVALADAGGELAQLVAAGATLTREQRSDLVGLVEYIVPLGAD